MRSLAVKLTIAFLLVGLTGAVLVAFMVRRTTQNEFDQLIQNQNQQALLQNLTAYYDAFGNWDTLEQVFQPAGGFDPGREGLSRWDARRILFAVADSEGIIVFGGRPELQGQQLSRNELRSGEPIELNGVTVGYLVYTPAIDRWRPGTPEGNFLANVNRAILISAVIATGVALILGGLLAYSLTRSLRELTAATNELAKGKLGEQVEVRSRDELGDLAESFNFMSTRLAQFNELRRKMTADIAHDLRTPLSIILGYTEALNDGKLSADPETMKVMHIEAQHLSHLIDDLRTLALAEAGELPLTRQLISPNTLLTRAAEVHKGQADQKKITIEVVLGENLPQVQVDVERMAQVMSNLMSNALRYTQQGGRITLSCSAQEDMVMMRVADTGEGIAPVDLPYIFERSYRADTSRQLNEGESGLGLAIAKSLVEAQQGTISVESELGIGTTFTIALPANG